LTTLPTNDKRFFIAGIGASAGGLEACEEFLRHLSNDTGMAFVLVQHLDPRHKSLLTELLSQVTAMPIHEVTDGMRVEPDHVYIIPPNAELDVRQGALHLMSRSVHGGTPLPIDHFFQSLAQDHGSMAIGIVLSGGASDGTIGLKAIKAEGGITFAQDEQSARYSSMPHSAISAGCADFIMSPKDIARELMRIARQPCVLRAIATPDTELPQENGDELNKIFALLRHHTGNDFTHYKHSTIRRRIHRRMVLHKIDRLKDYLRHLQEHPAELDELFQDILINVTGFFRDPEIFDALQKEVFPRLLQDREPETPIRIWVAGCSTGEEAYSVAMTLLEYLGDKASLTPIQIFASDIDETAIAKARAGIYPEGITADVSTARLQRFFSKTAAGYQISKSIRDLCVFAVQNVAKDPPFSHLDLVCCRNLLIYLSNVLQKKVLQIFHYALKPGGCLLLGSSESISSSPELFSLLDKKNKFYVKKSAMTLRQYELTSVTPDVAVHPNQGAQPIVTSSTSDLRDRAERILLDEYAPPAVIVNRDMEILQFRGHTGPYIEPVSGSASLNLMKMARADLIMELRTALHQAIKEDGRVLRENVHVGIGHEERRINLHVIPIKGPLPDERSYMITFEDDSPGQTMVREPSTDERDQTPGAKDIRIKELQQELIATREYLHAIIEDQETTNEELLSANEEIQSTNEELQSANEELETAKEELQSTNEELITANDELITRNIELSDVNNDLNTLLESVDLPIVMLSADMKIRHFTPLTAKLFNVIGADVGRPIGDIKCNVEIPDLEQRVHKVIGTATTDILEVRDSAGNRYDLRIRPYITIDARATGAVLVFDNLDGAA
jgi:two-component system CheB/CheR fusion protein